MNSRTPSATSKGALKRDRADDIEGFKTSKTYTYPKRSAANWATIPAPIATNEFPKVAKLNNIDKEASPKPRWKETWCNGRIHKAKIICLPFHARTQPKIRKRYTRWKWRCPTEYDRKIKSRNPRSVWLYKRCHIIGRKESSFVFGHWKVEKCEKSGKKIKL